MGRRAGRSPPWARGVRDQVDGSGGVRRRRCVRSSSEYSQGRFSRRVCVRVGFLKTPQGIRGRSDVLLPASVAHSVRTARGAWPRRVAFTQHDRELAEQHRHAPGWLPILSRPMRHRARMPSSTLDFPSRQMPSTKDPSIRSILSPDSLPSVISSQLL
jgi:hypothetical protein